MDAPLREGKTTATRPIQTGAPEGNLPPDRYQQLRMQTLAHTRLITGPRIKNPRLADGGFDRNTVGGAGSEGNGSGDSPISTSQSRRQALARFSLIRNRHCLEMFARIPLLSRSRIRPLRFGSRPFIRHVPRRLSAQSTASPPMLSSRQSSLTTISALRVVRLELLPAPFAFSLARALPSSASRRSRSGCFWTAQGPGETTYN